MMINSPIHGVFPISPRIKMHSPIAIIISMIIKGAANKLLNFLKPKLIASVRPGFSPFANCRAVIRQIAPPANDMSVILIIKNIVQ